MTAIAMTIFFNPSKVFCQFSADKIKYYILYDISGSVPNEDRHKNLQALLHQMIRRNGDKIGSETSFDLIFFGEDPDEPEGLARFDLYDRNKDDEAGITRELNRRYKEARSQKFTHVQVALDKAISLSTKFEGSSGFFLFTDGHLKPGDIANSDAHKQYVNKVDATINLLREGGKPVFLIQSSHDPESDYDSLQMHKVYKAIGDSIAVGINSFWVESNVEHGTKSYNLIRREFEKFLNNAHYSIIEAHRTVQEDDPMGKIILLAKIMSLRDKINSSEALAESPVSVQIDTLFKEAISGLEIKLNDTTILDLRKDRDLLRLLDYLKDKDDSQNKQQGYLFQGWEKLSTQYLLASANHHHTYDLFATSNEKALLDKLEEILDNTNALSRDQLIVLESVIQGLTAENYLEKIYESYKKVILENVEPISSISNPTLDFQLFDVPSITVEPTENKSEDRNLEEAIILGLTDYLLERTQQEAMFIFFENLHNRVFRPSTYIKDTLFYNVDRLIAPNGGNSDEIFEPNLVLIKEAFNKDIQQLPQNLSLHPKVRESDGLLSLTYALDLITNLTTGSDLEESFTKLFRNVPNTANGTTTLERGILFTAQFISFLEQHNLVAAYNSLSEKDLDRISKMAAVWFANKYPDIQQIRDLENLTIRIKEIFRSYTLLRDRIENIKKQLENLQPSADFQEYQNYKRALYLDILNNSTDILISGLDVIEHFAKEEDFKEIRSRLHEYQNLTQSAIDAWFKIKEKEYAKAVMLLLPMIPKLPQVEIPHVDKIESFKRIRIQLDTKKFEKIADSLNKHRTVVTALINKPPFDSKEQALTYLANNNLLFLKPLVLNADHSIGLPNGIDIGSLEVLYREVSKLKISGKKLSKVKTKLDSVWTQYPFFDQAIKDRLALYFINQLDFKDLTEDLKKLIAVAGEVSTAKSAGDVKNAMSKYAMPVASYRLKRKSRSNWMVNAYVGGGGSLYFKDDIEDKITPELTLNAPVGIEHSWSVNSNKMSFSFFMPIIDLGNIINYRIDEIKGNSSTSADDRTIKIENVISPGIYAILGLSKRYPFSTGLGYQMNPHRLNFMLAFDLPLFKISSR